MKQIRQFSSGATCNLASSKAHDNDKQANKEFYR
jgi:hypothetical protein